MNIAPNKESPHYLLRSMNPLFSIKSLNRFCTKGSRNKYIYFSKHNISLNTHCNTIRFQTNSVLMYLGGRHLEYEHHTNFVLMYLGGRLPEKWITSPPSHHHVMVWYIWKWPNHKIFNDSRASFISILPCICSLSGNRV